MADLKTITDTVHGTIRLDPLTVDLLETLRVNPAAVADLIRGPSERGAGLLVPGSRKESKRYLAQIIHSPMDADQIDYLMRDAHYTGASHGTIDFSRLLQTLRTHRGELALDRKGLPALEGMLVARGLMYSSVYFHKTVRIAEEMLARAVERSDAPIADIQKMVDHELLNWLVHQRPLQREIALRLEYRKLYKRVLASDRADLTAATRAVLASFKDPNERRRVEGRIARRAGVRPGQVIVVVPLPQALCRVPAILRTEVPIFDDGDVKPFSKGSPLGRALQVRQVVDWVVMVAAPAEAVDSVCKGAMTSLFGARPPINCEFRRFV